MGGVSLLTLLIPEAAKLGGKTGYPYYLIIVRFFMGVCEAGTFPCITGKNINTITYLNFLEISHLNLNICVNVLDDRDASQVGSTVREGQNLYNCYVRNANWDNCWLLCFWSSAGPVGMGECILHPGCSLLCLACLLVTAGL